MHPKDGAPALIRGLLVVEPVRARRVQNRDAHLALHCKHGGKEVAGQGMFGGRILEGKLEDSHSKVPKPQTCTRKQTKVAASIPNVRKLDLFIGIPGQKAARDF